MTRKENVVESDFVQATDEAHSDIVRRLLVLATRNQADFGAEEDVVTDRFQVEDVVDTRSRTLGTMRPVDSQLGHTSVTFQADVVPNAVIDNHSSDSHQSFAASAIETILNLSGKVNCLKRKLVIRMFICANLSVDDL